VSGVAEEATVGQAATLAHTAKAIGTGFLTPRLHGNYTEADPAKLAMRLKIPKIR
jgi:hypothetical protein